MFIRARDNILDGKLDATDEEIIAAAKAVNAHDFILKLEKGYDTVLSERGEMCIRDRPDTSQ